jgi:hypothetical protein
MIQALIPAAAADIASVVLLTLNLALLGWCIISLKAVPADVASASENASS